MSWYLANALKRNLGVLGIAEHNSHHALGASRNCIASFPIKGNDKLKSHLTFILFFNKKIAI